MYSGMLSKSRGQVLRVAAVIHMMFSIDNANYEVEEVVTEKSVKAAINLVQTACQQTAFIENCRKKLCILLKQVR